METADVPSQNLNNFTKTLSFIDRYFTRNYHETDHLYYFEHSNGLVLCGLSNEHPIIKEKLKVDSLEFMFKPPTKEEEIDDEKVEKQGDFRNLVSGKKKRGGIKIIPTMKLFKIVCGERQFMIRSHILGYIIELSPHLLAKDYEYLTSDPEGAGYFFIANPPSEAYVVGKEVQGIRTIPKTW